MMSRVALLPNVETERNARLRAKLERWFTVTPAMLQSIDEAGRLIAASDAWLAKLGYKREEVIGRLSSDFLTPESREHAIKNVLPEFFRRGHCENVEYQMVAKDGRVIDVLLSSVLDDDVDRSRSRLADRRHGRDRAEGRRAAVGGERSALQRTGRGPVGAGVARHLGRQVAIRQSRLCTAIRDGSRTKWWGRVFSTLSPRKLMPASPSICEGCAAPIGASKTKTK